jgi:hypothetical protein
MDFKCAWRGIVRRPGFSAVVVFTLAVGMGATIALFSLVRAVFLRPLPAPGRRVARLESILPSRCGANKGWSAATDNTITVREEEAFHSRVAASLAPFRIVSQMIPHNSSTAAVNAPANSQSVV